MVVIASLVFLSQRHEVFRYFAGGVVAITAVFFAPALPSLLLLMQFVPSVVLNGASVVPGSEAAFLALMLLSFVARRGSRQPRGIRNELGMPWAVGLASILFLALVVASRRWNASGAVSMSLLNMLGYTAAILTATTIRKRSHQIVMLLTFVVVSVVLGMWLTRNAGAFQSEWGERGPDSIDPNYCAFYVGTGIIAALCMLIEGRFRKGVVLRVLLACAICIAAVGVLCTASRGISAAVALAGCVILAIRYRSPWKIAIIVLLLALVAPLVYQLPAFDALRSRVASEHLGEMSGRATLWRECVNVSCTLFGSRVGFRPWLRWEHHSTWRACQSQHRV